VTPRITLVVCLCLLVCVLARAAEPPATEMALDIEERALLSLINEYRVARGVEPLRLSQTLTRCAEWMTGDMATKFYFDHTDSTRRDPFKRMAAFGYSYKGQRGENVAAGFSDAARIFALWQGSPDHHNAMLEPSYRVIGLARAQSSHTGLRWVWVADFGSYVDETFEVNAAQLASVSNVNAAQSRNAVAALTVAIISGENLSRCTAVANHANGKPLPTSLCETTLTVNGRPAPLYSVSPTQIHYVVPASPGTAKVAVLSGERLVAAGEINIASAVNSTNLVAAEREPNSLLNQLALYGTDLRNCSSLKQLEVKVNNQLVKVRYARPNENRTGLDQLNLELPEALQSAAVWQVSLSVDGKAINPVSLKAMRQDDNQRGAAPAEGFR
jgi:Cysteine-rich secretory protein family